MNKQRNSLILIVVIAVAALIVSAAPMLGASVDSEPVSGPKAEDSLRKVLRINGNRNNDWVIFKHEEHKERMGGEDGCADCHHLYTPGNTFSQCFHCHADMTQEKSIFSHADHQAKLGDKDSCAKCHDLAVPKAGETATDCSSCHSENMGMAAMSGGGKLDVMAPGYQDAMHELCVDCHQKQEETAGHENLANCDTCHIQVQHQQGDLTR
jgi:Zn finger protein HypA/HybF involved in hydrogenase expression